MQAHRAKFTMSWGDSGWGDSGWTVGAHQSLSITPPPQLDRGEKIQQWSYR